MSKKKHKTIAAARDRPTAPSSAGGGQKRSLVYLGDWSSDGSLACAGYTTLAHSPEVSAAVDRIAALIGAMPIHKLRNVSNGNIRVRDDATARIVDVEPNSLMSRSQFIRWIVRTLYLEGNGNAVVLPRSEGGRLSELIPIPAAYTAFYPTGLWGYRVAIAGRPYDPQDVLHFALNPGSFYPWLGQGYRVTLADVANNLKQAAATEQGFMESKWKPAIIIRVDANTEEFSSKEGRKRLLEEYVEASEAGEPWMLPLDQFEVQTVKPLSLSDLALADFVELDKKTVASILGVPAFVLGVGEFHRDEWNNFINAKIMPLAQILEQEFTRKLIVEPTDFFRFNSWSLYSYDLRDMAAIADDQYVRGLMDGNEARDWLGMPPRDGLDDLIILENYIPRGMIGEQSKLNGGQSNG